MDSNTRKVLKILTLSIFFFISGLAFFYFRMNPEDSSLNESTYLNVVTKQREDREMILKNMPAPEEFDHFVYNVGKTIKVSGECQDTYKAILVYPASVDYRFDPLSAKYNTASACKPGTDFEEEISLDGLNMESGEKYYIVRAHQSDREGWYKPY